MVKEWKIKTLTDSGWPFDGKTLEEYTDIVWNAAHAASNGNVGAQQALANQLKEKAGETLAPFFSDYTRNAWICVAEIVLACVRALDYSFWNDLPNMIYRACLKKVAELADDGKADCETRMQREYSFYDCDGEFEEWVDAFEEIAEAQNKHREKQLAEIKMDDEGELVGAKSKKRPTRTGTIESIALAVRDTRDLDDLPLDTYIPVVRKLAVFGIISGSKSRSIILKEYFQYFGVKPSKKLGLLELSDRLSTVAKVRAGEDFWQSLTAEQYETNLVLVAALADELGLELCVEFMESQAAKHPFSNRTESWMEAVTPICAFRPKYPNRK